MKIKFVYPIPLSFQDTLPGAPRLIEPGQRIEVDDELGARLLRQPEHWQDVSEPGEPVEIPRPPQLRDEPEAVVDPSGAEPEPAQE